MDEGVKPTALGDLLRQQRGRQSIAVMAGRLNVNKNTLGAYERGQRLPDLEFLARFARVAGTRFRDLLQARLASSQSPALRTLPAEMAADPLFGVPDPGGRGELFVPPFATDVAREGGPNAAPAGPLGFRRDWLERNGMDPAHILQLRVHTDAMQPTVMPGDLVLLDLRRVEIADGVCALRARHGLLLRRLQRLPGQRLALITDNPRYQDHQVDLSTLTGASPELAVCGRMVWISRRTPG